MEACHLNYVTWNFSKLLLRTSIEFELESALLSNTIGMD